MAGYFEMVNASGGINGRKVTLYLARQCLQSSQGDRADAQAG